MTIGNGGMVKAPSLKTSSRTRPLWSTRSLAPALAFVVGVSSVGIPRTSAAGEGDKAVCADSYRNAQTHRRSGELKRAREALLVCASDRCPQVLQPDCMRWLGEVEAAIPTLAFAAKGSDGRDLVDVHVTLDNEPLTEHLDGKAMPVDPGQHTVRFERPGETPIEQAIVVREGEKARVIAVSWAKAPVQTSTQDEGASPTKGGVPTAAWVLGGVGVAGLATFAVLGLTGMQRRSTLEKDCYGSCTQPDVDSVKTQFLAADIALGVGVVSLGVATVLFLTQGGSKTEKPAASTETARAPARPKPPVSVDVAFRAGGASAGLSGQF